jgi:hypothetical protein
MRRQAWTGAILLALSAAGWAFGGEPYSRKPARRLLVMSVTTSMSRPRPVSRQIVA